MQEEADEERPELGLLGKHEHGAGREQVAKGQQSFGTDKAVGDVRDGERSEERGGGRHGQNGSHLVRLEMEVVLEVVAHDGHGRARHEVLQEHHDRQPELEGL